MKKLKLLAFILTASFYSSAQSDVRFTIGTKGGFGHSFIIPYQNYSFHPLWNIGLTTAYQVSEHFAIGADALYSSEGASFKIGENKSTVNLDYLRIPLRAMYVMGSSANDFRPRLTLAPTFGVLMAEGTGYRDMDFGLNGGLGFSYELLHSFWITVDANYYHGLMDINAMNAEKERNGNIRLEIGLTFGL